MPTLLARGPAETGIHTSPTSGLDRNVAILTFRTQKHVLRTDRQAPRESPFCAVVSSNCLIERPAKGVRLLKRRKKCSNCVNTVVIYADIMSRRFTFLVVTGHLPALIWYEDMDRSSLRFWITFLSQRTRRRGYRAVEMEVHTWNSVRSQAYDECKCKLECLLRPLPCGSSSESW